MFKKIKGSLSFKMILLLNAFLVLPSIIILVFFQTKVSNSFAAEIKKNLVSLTHEKLDKLDVVLNGLEDKAFSFAEQLYVKDFFAGLSSGKPVEQIKLRRIATVLENEFKKENGIYENLLYNYNELPIVDAIGGKSARVRIKNERIIGGIMISPSSGRPVMINFIPVDGKAMFIMAIELNRITNRIISNSRDGLMKTIIINYDGLVIASENKDWIMKYNFAEAEGDTARFFQNLKTKGSGTDFVTLDGHKYVAAYVKDPTRPFYLISYTPISQYTRQTRELSFAILAILLICIVTGIFVSNYVTRRLIEQPIQNLTAATERMVLGDCDVLVTATSQDEIGTLAKSFNTMVANIRDGALAAERIAAGDLDVRLPVRSENDLLNKNLNHMIDNIKLLIADINILAEGASNGDLAVRVDEAKHYGDFRKIVAGINRTLELIIQPLNEGIEVLRMMALNDYAHLMEPQKYQGMLHRFAEEVNTVRTRLLDVQDAFVRVSQGDLSRLEEYRKIGKYSENDQITPATIAMMEVINTLINEIARLSRAAVTGELNARGDASRFKGGYQQIIQGLNQTLDAIVAPLNEASTVLQEMAGGNLGVAVNGDYQGDYAVLAEAVNRTISSFNETLNEIREAARQVAAGAEQIAGSSQGLSQATTEQAATVEQINASLNEITNQTKLNALNAGQANELSQSAQATAANGNIRMKDMLTAMEEINNSSATISKIIKVIDEIAFQTNILSLNAAVEAARAGEHGKGFAVVAEEVRNLAARSANAAKETTQMIEASIKNVESGATIAHETAAELNRIVESVGKTAVLVGEIATATKEQATGIVQISQGIEQVSQVTQTSTATAQESAASSEELAAQAEFLKGKIAQFKLKNATIELNSPAQIQKPALTGKTATVSRKIQLCEDDFGKY
jgi:methyl-accepting chemotaxis protein